MVFHHGHGRGHHALPYLWRRAVAGAMPLEPGSARGARPEALGPMVEAFTKLGGV